jgi:hypothetical protein
MCNQLWGIHETLSSGKFSQILAFAEGLDFLIIDEA